MELTPRGRNQGHVVTFDRDADSFVEEDKELQSKWAAIEKLPTFKRIKTSFVDEITQEESGSRWQRSSSKRVVDVTKLGAVDKRLFIDKLIKHIENDNLNLLQKLRERMERVNVKLPSVEVRYKNLNVEAECEVVQGKPLPTLWNSFSSLFSGLMKTISCSSQETKLGILKDVSGVIKPARLTLLLGPPSCGKTTLLMALAGKLDQSLEVSGEICYNGHRLDEFVPQKTSAYISQYDLHIPEMTVRETIDFSARCQGVGSRADIMTEITRKEKEQGIFPDPDLDTYMKAISVEGQSENLQTEYVLKILGLDICADTLVGDALDRGISGGQKKRLTTGEMIVGPIKALFMDEISTGLDSSTTFQIVTCLQQLVHINDATAVLSLLQPAPETFELFDDFATQEPNEIVSALTLLDAALAISPSSDQALELKARSSLYLRRFKDVANMLQDYIPSLKMANDDSGSVSSDGSSQQLSREGVKLLSSSDSSDPDQSFFKCFSVSDLKKRVMAGLCKSSENEGYWRYLVLGKACCHLGLMEDALVLLQTGKRLASAAFRRESVCWSDDSFSLWNKPFPGDAISTTPPRSPLSESETVNQLIAHIKFLLRRRAAAIAAMDAGLHTEAIRHFSKIVDGRRGAPQGFLAECYMHRATAFRSAGRIADSIADCNRTLSLDPTCIQALESRASILETIRSYQDCLHDLEHLKLLYNTILRDRKLAGPLWKRHNVRYNEIPGKLCTLTAKINFLKQKMASGETRNVDYYALIGLRRGCGRSELQRAHLLLCLKHKPEKATCFIERCELADERDLESVKDRTRMASMLLYRLLQKGYSSVMNSIAEDEIAEKERKIALQLQQTSANANVNVNANVHSVEVLQEISRDENMEEKFLMSSPSIANPTVFQGVFCRDLTVVGNLLSQRFSSRSIPVKYEALSC